MPSTQLCLLGGELMPNVIGVLHDRPDRVIPVVTRESAPQVGHLKAALRAAECRTAVHEPITVLPFDLADCLESIEKVATATPQLTVNWTGGTKIMSYAARRIAETSPEGMRAMYVNTAGRQLLVADDASSSRVRTELLDAAQLGLNTLVHILAAGHTVERGATLKEFRAAHAPPPELVTAAEMLVDARPWWPDLFKLADAEHSPYAPRKLKPRFLEALAAAKIIQRAGQPGRFFLGTESLIAPFHRSSPPRENAKFIRGGYLEVFLWSQLRRRGAFDDVAWHVTLNPGQKGHATELDVAVAADGRLLVVESKGRIELAKLPDLIEEQAARTRRVGRLFGHWLLYVHQCKADFADPHAASIIASQTAKAKVFHGRLLWQDDLADLPILVASYLHEAGSEL